MKGIWLWASDINYDIFKMKSLKPFDTIYLDIEKDTKKGLHFINKTNEWNIFPVVNCFENREPDNDEDYDEVLQLIESYKQFGNNLMLDFIRYTHVAMSPESFRKIESVVKFASNLFKNLKVTILPFGEFYGQNHWKLRKYATICPMLYYSPFWFGIMKRLYGDCEPVIKGWDTNQETIDKCIQKSGFSWSIFRYFINKDERQL